jgi:ATP-dependent protease HslVU (ClpYQ) peptidase subunit
MDCGRLNKKILQEVYPFVQERRKKMTALAAMIDKQTGRAYMAFDSVVYWENKVISDIRPKGIIRRQFGENPNFLIGTAGHCRVSNLVLYELDIPKFSYDDSGSEMQYMVRKFVPELQNLLNSGGTLESENSILRQPAHVIVAFNGHLFVIQNGFGVIEPEEKYFATGSGEEFCLATIRSLLIHRSEDISVCDILETAIENACFFAPSCQKPIHVIWDK